MISKEFFQDSFSNSSRILFRNFYQNSSRDYLRILSRSPPCWNSIINSFRDIFRFLLEIFSGIFFQIIPRTASGAGIALEFFLDWNSSRNSSARASFQDYLRNFSRDSFISFSYVSLRDFSSDLFGDSFKDSHAFPLKISSGIPFKSHRFLPG